MTELSHLAKHAEAMAQIAARSSLSYFRGALGVEFKADESPVTQADKAVEAELRAYLAAIFPDHGIFGEEEGMSQTDSAHLWVIDPIDGTRSFLSGHPLYGFLLAHLIDGTPEIGVIGMPVLEEVLIGQRGQGARLNGRPVQTSNQTDLAQGILYINEGEKIFRDHPALFDRLTRTGQTRRMAYDCYPHALLAMGHVNAVVDYDLQPYDFLALSVVIEAAGGVMTDWSGAPLGLHSDGRVVSAATPELHEQLLQVVNG
ncbi:histidinol-phosphatase, inositol monophosphatase family [Aliiroseovarius crassostreae]|uniref:Inositol monophosphatase n=1 Tax=Aliiroseovarius crassostreae TaxID=154981 RepID=A0A0P7KJH2_9RHOB|nr:inositol monophosphatase family protein [Aliiroseovarius crassostreae]KPN63866.1 inositol monophosphatase [Aliiroseovarius crassostreae]SFU83045.1 histidinol-phosphatase, inositol monophosphatase family [Aliiroseovarius crassostreae]